MPWYFVAVAEEADARALLRSEVPCSEIVDAKLVPNVERLADGVIAVIANADKWALLLS